MTKKPKGQATYGIRGERESSVPLSSRQEEISSPEALTPAQERLAETMLTTKVRGKAPILTIYEDGTFSIAPNEKTVPLVALRPEEKGQYALKLHEENPYEQLSPYFVNFRNLPTQVILDARNALAEIEGEGTPDFCVGIPKAGTILGKAYGEEKDIPHIEIFDKQELAGGKRKIIPSSKLAKEGMKKARFIDDLISGAHTKLEAIKVAREMGYEVLDLYVVLDREQGGREELEKAGVKLHSALTMTQLIDYGVRKGHISDEDARVARQYLNDNKPKKDLSDFGIPSPS
ncbi:MAG: hypothetical protein V1697_02485 [Candidatus Levyibacteriota bacterium]